MVSFDISDVILKTRQNNDSVQVYDPVRRAWVSLTPEEHVRQVVIQALIANYEYPMSMFSVEKRIMVNKMEKRYDAVIYGKNLEPWMLIECKAPSIDINSSVLHQTANYYKTVNCPYILLTIGTYIQCGKRQVGGNLLWLATLPTYDL